MQPLQYDLRCPAAKDNSITHTAAAPSNLHAAMMTARSAITALQIKLQLRRPPLQSTRSKMDAAITLLGQPKITKPIGTAQSTISLLDMNNESALYHGRSETNAKPTQSHPSHRRGSPHPRHAGSHFVRENAGFHAIPNTQTSPGHSSSTAICNHCLANHTTTASTTAEINKVDAAITLQTATQDHQTHWHSAVNHVMAWLENALYNGRSETNAKPTQPHPSHRRGSPH